MVESEKQRKSSDRRTIAYRRGVVGATIVVKFIDSCLKIIVEESSFC